MSDICRVVRALFIWYFKLKMREKKRERDEEREQRPKGGDWDKTLIIPAASVLLSVLCWCFLVSVVLFYSQCFRKNKQSPSLSIAWCRQWPGVTPASEILVEIMRRSGIRDETRTRENFWRIARGQETEHSKASICLEAEQRLRCLHLSKL